MNKQLKKPQKVPSGRIYFEKELFEEQELKIYYLKNNFKVFKSYVMFPENTRMMAKKALNSSC